MSNKIPKATAKRLPLYYRLLSNLLDARVERVSSTEISEATKIDPATIRRDFSCFGALGKKGYGYDVAHMVEFFKSELSQDQVTKGVLIGAGKLGSAFLNYNFAKSNGAQIVAAFDVRDEVVGTNLGDISVYHMNDLEAFLEKEEIKVVIIMVPVTAAQSIADRLSKTKIKGILNFAPVMLDVSDHITVRNIDLSVEIQSLIYFMK